MPVTVFTPGWRKKMPVMAVVMIEVDPREASHAAVAISAAGEPLGRFRVRGCAVQAERLLGWARAWAAAGLGGGGRRGAGSSAGPAANVRG